MIEEEEFLVAGCVWRMRVGLCLVVPRIEDSMPIIDRCLHLFAVAVRSTVCIIGAAVHSFPFACLPRSRRFFASIDLAQPKAQFPPVARLLLRHLPTPPSHSSPIEPVDCLVEFYIYISKL